MKTAGLLLLLGMPPYVVHAFVLPTSCVSMTCKRTVNDDRTSRIDAMSRNNAPASIRSRVEHVVGVALATSVLALGTSAPVFADALPSGTNPFTSICMGFGCGEFKGLEYPGAPAPTDEDSITFKSFLESLDKGLIAKVDFAAGGNKAYAFVKPSGGGEGEPTRIRVGEGYPDDQGNGWSSPLWVVRALNDRHIPYHFDYSLGKGRATNTLAK